MVSKVSNMTTEPWTDSRTPALALLARGDQIEVRSPTEFSVKSQSRQGVEYTVRAERGRFVCDCSYFRGTARACLHVLAIRFRVGFQEKAPKVEVAPSCPECRSGNTVGGGRRLNKSGAVRRWICRACGAYFSGREGFRNRRSDPEMIAKALDLYFRGVSLRQVAAHFEQVYGLRVGASTVYRWVAHYSALAAEWMDRQRAQVGSTWHADERFLNVNGERAYLWNVMDSETRFLLASTVSEGRGVAEARAAFQLAKGATDVRPTEVRTDGLAGYIRAVSKEFGSNYGPGGKMHSPHRVVPSIRAPESNNRIERMNGGQKDRTKTMRAYDNVRGAGNLSAGWRVHYNLVRMHMAIGTTPGVAAGLPEIGGFRWRAILDMAAISRNETTAPGEGA